MARKTKAKYKPPQFNVQVNALIDIGEEVSELFNAILYDYCNRFNTKVIDERKNSKIMLSLIQGGSDPSDMDGLCAFEHMIRLNTIAIQVRCMILENMEPSDYAVQHWIEVLAHEFVHVCQCLTKRSMEPISQTMLGVQTEEYYFDADEVEARILQAFYANKMSLAASTSIIQKIRDCYGEGDLEEFELELQQLVELQNKG